VTELILLWDEKYLKPRPKNRISVPLRGSVQNFSRATPSFSYGSVMAYVKNGRAFSEWMNTPKLIDHLQVFLLFSKAP